MVGRRRVLLVSPVPELDPPCGDVTYTQNLLSHAPANVEYETYAEALAAGKISELGRRSEYRAASGLRRLQSLCRIGRERGINELRERGVLFREPFRYFSVRPGAYDLVHCHVFSAGFPGLDAPLVMSNASTIEELYLGARGWSERRVALASRADAALASRLGVQHTSHEMPKAAAVVCFTEFLRNELLSRRSTQRERLFVAPCFVEPARRNPASHRPHRIGFVAGDFEAKGGRTVIDAFEIVRRYIPDAELLIVGSPPRGDPSELLRRGIIWRPWVERSELLGSYLPTLDVFAYPTECDGLPLTVLEVMAGGIPVATSDHGAMPEIVGHGQAGAVTPTGDALALGHALLKLLAPDENVRARERTAAWFDRHYAPAVAVAQLLRAYDAAAGDRHNEDVGDRVEEAR